MDHGNVAYLRCRNDFLSGKIFEALRDRGNYFSRANGLLHLRPCDSARGRFRAGLQGPGPDGVIVYDLLARTNWSCCSAVEDLEETVAFIFGKVHGR